MKRSAQDLADIRAALEQDEAALKDDIRIFDGYDDASRLNDVTEAVRARTEFDAEQKRSILRMHQ